MKQYLKMHWRWWLAPLGGLLYPLGFAPFEYRSLLWLSLGLLFLVVQDGSKKQVFLRGWLWGLVAFGVGVSWVFNSMHDFGGASPVAAGAFTLALVAYMAIYPALCGVVWIRFFRSQSAVPQVLGFALLWAVTEWLRAWVLTGFPWLMSGYGAMDSFFADYLPVIGALGVGFLMALCAAVLVKGFQKPRFLSSSVALVFVVFAASLGLSEWEALWTPDGQVDVSLVQGNVPQNIKMDRNYRYVSLNAYEGLSRFAYDRSDIIVWPETAMPDYASLLQPFLDKIKRDTKHKRAVVFTGIFTQAPKEQGGRYYNSMVSLNDEQQQYNKHQLVPFGEYMPLRWVLTIFERFVQIPMSDMASGERLTKPVQLNGVAVAPSICYEMAYPDVLRASIKGSQLMINTSNDAWFGDSFAPKQHLEMARVRSKAFHKPMARATNNGITATIDANGYVQKTIPAFKAGLLNDRLALNVVVTPYAHIGQWFVGCVLSTCLLILVLLVRFVRP